MHRMFKDDFGLRLAKSNQNVIIEASNKKINLTGQTKAQDNQETHIQSFHMVQRKYIYYLIGRMIAFTQSFCLKAAEIICAMLNQLG